MAGSVESTIKINVEMQGNVNEQINSINSQINSIRESLNNAMNEPLSATDVELNKINQSISDVANNINKSFNIDTGIKAPDNAFFGKFDTEEVEIPDDLLGDMNDETIKNMSESLNGLNMDAMGAAKSLVGMATSGGISASSMSSLAASLGVTGPALGAVAIAVTALIAVFKSFKSNVDDMFNTFEKVGDFLGDSITDGFEIFKDTLENIIELTDEAIDKVTEFSDIGIEIQNDYFALYNTLGTEASEGIRQFADSLESSLNLDATGVVSDMQKMLAITQRLGRTTQETEKYTEKFYMTAQNMSKAYGVSLDSINQSISMAINSGSIRGTSPLAKILGSDGIEQFKQLNTERERANYILEKGIALEGVYIQYLNTDAGKIEQLKQQYQSFLGNVGQLILGIYAKVAPLLTALLSLANHVVNSLMKLFNIDVQSNTNNNIDNMLNNSTDALNNYSEAVDTATRKQASFDDVIQITDSSSSSLLGNIVSPDDINLLQETTAEIEKTKSKLEELIDELKALWDAGDYKGTGSLLSDTIKEWLQGINWNEIKSMTTKFGADLAAFFNGLFYDIGLGKEVGNALAQVFNTIASAIHGFLFGDMDNPSGFDFEQFGRWIGAAWKSLWENIDTQTVANDLYGVFMGIIHTIQGFFEEGSLSDAFGSIGDIIAGFFNNFTEADINDAVDAVVSLVDNIINGLGTLWDKIDQSSAKEKIKAFLKKLIESFSTNAGDWGETLNKIITDVLDLAGELLDTADESGLTEAINKFIEKLDLGTILTKYMDLKFKIWCEEMKVKIPMWLDLAAGFLNSEVVRIILFIFGGISTQIFAGITALIGLIVEHKEEIVACFNEIGKSISEWWTEFSNNVAEWWGSVGVWWNSVISGLKSINLYEAGKNILNSLWSGLESVWNSIKSWWNNLTLVKGVSFKAPSWLGGQSVNISLPKLAKGGIVNQATAAIVGEAGAEAIMPLENNTGWMNTLAELIASKINNNSNSSNSSGTVIIDMSKFSKNFYTRNEMLAFGQQVVEALKLQNVNIAMSY